MTEFVQVRGGTLAMGSDLDEVEQCVRTWSDRLVDVSYRAKFRSWIMKEFPRHAVDVGPLLAWKFPVTNAEFRCFVEESGADAPESVQAGEPAEHPVWGVSLDSATDYARWRGHQDGRAWRLPTEAEWEWLARGPDGSAYPFGAHFDARACNTVERGMGGTTPVHAHPQGESWCGALDLAGNVEEWTLGRYSPYPGGEFVQDDLTELLGPDYPITRGGCFNLGGDLARCARRHGPHPSAQFRFIGFRLVSDAPQEQAA